MPDTQDQLAVYGAHCVWWDTIDKTARTPSGLPCCPHCGSVLFQQPLDEWWKGVDKHKDDRVSNYRDFIEWLRGKCFPNIVSAIKEYKLQKGIGGTEKKEDR